MNNTSLLIFHQSPFPPPLKKAYLCITYNPQVDKTLQLLLLHEER